MPCLLRIPCICCPILMTMANPLTVLIFVGKKSSSLVSEIQTTIISFVLTYVNVSILLLSSETTCDTKPCKWDTHWLEFIGIDLRLTRVNSSLIGCPIRCRLHVSLIAWCTVLLFLCFLFYFFLFFLFFSLYTS